MLGCDLCPAPGEALGTEPKLGAEIYGSSQIFEN